MTPSAGPPPIRISPIEPIRSGFETGGQDRFDPVTPMPDDMHDRTLAAERMAEVPAGKGHTDRFPFSRHALHGDRHGGADARPGPRVAMGG